MSAARERHQSNTFLEPVLTHEIGLKDAQTGFAILWNSFLCNFVEYILNFKKKHMTSYTL